VRILITGASGFVGATLVPRLLADGHQLRALAREPARVQSALRSLPDAGVDPTKLEVLRGDAISGAGLTAALDGVEVAYYLIHSMESSAGPTESFAERERIAARRFATAARAAGVARIVYLGGLLPLHEAASRHLASREAVERILIDAVPDSVALRSSIVIGARSRSFRFLVHLVEKLPVLALPSWQRFRTQPIDARDVTELLVAAASAPAVIGRSLDVGGPDLLSYGAMIERIAELMLVSRLALRLPFTITPVAARVASAITREDSGLILPLMESLESDLLPREDHAAELLGVRLHSFDAAVERALRDWENAEPLRAR
jgi:uncharacterized protein YbjT (DUF2867 family)